MTRGEAARRSSGGFAGCLHVPAGGSAGFKFHDARPVL